MAAREFFFPKSWIGRELGFTWPQHSNWRIMKKISEKYQQLTLYDVEDPAIGGPNLFFADAAFLCQNTSNPGEEVFIKVYKQIPHHATELKTPTVRREQAGTRTHPEIEAYKWSRENTARESYPSVWDTKQSSRVTLMSFPVVTSTTWHTTSSRVCILMNVNAFVMPFVLPMGIYTGLH